MKRTNKLSSEQTENWRKILVLQFGPIALTFSDKEIQRHRDMTQQQVNNLELPNLSENDPTSGEA